MAILEAILDRITNWGTVALGIGFVIFIHELGHFLAAKWAGVKVEKFSVGFGRALIAWRRGMGFRFGSSTMREYNALMRGETEGLQPVDIHALGETEYALSMIPLGGYVKMLGQEDVPEGDAGPITDPRAYPNKSVGARMAIISAGVTMNLLSGLLFFVAAYGWGGMPTTPPLIGLVDAAQPAYAAGIRPGDRIVTVDGRREYDFDDVAQTIALTGSDQVLSLELERPGHPDPIRVAVAPRREPGRLNPTIGIGPARGLVLDNPPLFAPAGLDPSAYSSTNLKAGDRIIAASPDGEPPVPVADSFALDALLAEHRDRPVRVVVEREREATGSGKVPDPVRIEQVLPVVPMVDPGFRLVAGPVVAIRPGSPAERAGLRAGDRIVSVDGREDFDPMRLPDEARARAGDSMAFRVLRSEAGKPAEPVELSAVPDASPPWVEPIGENEPLEVPGLGMALAVVPEIASVRPDGPAAQAGLGPGDRIATVTLTAPPLNKSQKPKEIAFKLDGVEASWPGMFFTLQYVPHHRIALTIEGRKEPVRLTPGPDPSWPNPSRGLRLRLVESHLGPMTVGDSIRRGVADTRDLILKIYQMFRSLIFGRMSPKNLGGPILIAVAGSQRARMGLVAFVRFLGLLSINLAVINFLPLPPLDGGHMMFLTLEKILGRPVPDRFQGAVVWIGLFLLLALMLFVLWQDLYRFIIEPWLGS